MSRGTDPGSPGSPGSEAAPRALRLLSRLVPRDRREAWLREWTAEAAHAAAPGGHGGHGGHGGNRGNGGHGGPGGRGGREGGSSGRAVLVAALEDAAVLRLRSLSPGGSAMDLRYAVRSLGRRPGFAAIVILTLGLGLGATVAIASAVRGVLLRPLPWDDPDGIAFVTTAFRGHFDAPRFPASVPEYLDLKADHPAFSDLAAFSVGESNLGGTVEPRRVTVVQTTPNLLPVLGVTPAMGRGFTDEEGRPGSARATLLSHGLWIDGFGADPGVVGREVRVDEIPYVVVGILGRDFEFPGAEADLLTALRIDPAETTSRSSHWVDMLGRLRDGTDVPAARALTGDLLSRWEETYAGQHAPDAESHPVVILGIRETVVGDMDRPLLILFGAVLLVLLVACLNVANLLLVRGEDRAREFGVRAALGADRGRLVRQLLVESGILAVAGGAVGLGLAVVALRLLPGLAEGTLPPNAAPTLDGSVLGFAAVLVLGVTILFGVVPALAARGDVARSLREGGKATSGRSRLAFRRALVVTEVAAAVALIAGAGVLGRGFSQIMAVDPGFEPDGVLLFDLELNAGSYPTASDVAAFHRELKERAEALAGVLSVGALRTAPLTGGGGWESVSLPGETPPEEGDGRSWIVQYQVADPGVFDALGVPLLEGRDLRPGDDAEAPRVVVVNRAAARGLWGDGESPLGREVRLGPPPPAGPNPAMTVVGVVADARQTALDQEPPAQIFVPRGQAGGIYQGLGSRLATVVVRTDGAPLEALPALRALVRDLDPLVPLASPRTLREQIVRSVGDRRFVAILMGLFSATAAALGAVGLYGLMAYVVSRRSREIGIRYALGAGRGGVVGRIVGEAGVLAALGSILGIALAWIAGDVLEGLIFGVSARDPLAFAGAPLLLVAVGLLAAWLPARRASAVDPALVLREE